MKRDISPRLQEIVHALPIRKGMKVMEIGCGSGVVARELSNKLDDGYVLAIDRSPKAISQAIKMSSAQLKNGNLEYINSSIEELEFAHNDYFDIIFAIRVGVLDGRHPERKNLALDKIRRLLKPGGKLYIDGGKPLQEIFTKLIQ
ncbi:class I SAM-dependent methyltransferase [Flavobacterium selenitireducens]|uniref:class I SAM-dependent methyltransferase n=1 Tax=Flavobacterium selenitireducens TaxID=2722704 RepID=UPI00168B4241|nr:methyltransferase domain-containing protein [Flavobacterium selenitireducens]MBD3584076.1 methyltransferase domain-containing protein [Flavobacterium selenitireducens]